MQIAFLPLSCGELKTAQNRVTDSKPTNIALNNISLIVHSSTIK